VKRPLSLAFLLSLSAAGWAKPRSGVQSTAFDGTISGARFIGMGEIGAAAVGGPESPIWNPAGLHDVRQPIFSADFDVARQSRIDTDVLLGDTPLRGRKLTYLGFASTDAGFFYRPLSNYNVRFSTDPFNFREENLKVSQIGFSAASEGEKGAVVGLNLTYLNAHLARASQDGMTQPAAIDFADGHGFTLDLGLRRNWEQGSFGAAFFNIPGIIYWNQFKADQLPVLMRTGASFYPVPMFGLLAEYDKRFYRGGLPKPDAVHLGMEFTPLRWFQVRGGVYGEDLNEPEKTSYTGGFTAASAGGYQVDFALRTYRFQDERVYNYFLSILVPLPETNVRDDVRPATRYQGKGLGAL
jgi:hypothetical protein